jgi:CHASE2 domain-containing sensor protein
MARATALAELVEAVAAADPAVIAIDILLEGPDRFSPQPCWSLCPIPSAADVLAGLDEGDARLRAALAMAPTALGIALATGRAGLEVPSTPVLLASPCPGYGGPTGCWDPSRVVAAGAQGFGVLVAAADPDERVRRVPLLVLAGKELPPGLAVEAVRLAQRAAGLLIDASDTGEA